VATDGRGRIDPCALSDTLAADRDAGCVPVMIGATAGTTDAGIIDPLTACAEIADSFGLWFHVDAARGGAAIASDRLRALVAGLEGADSFTIDAHKWFATTMGCGMFITRNAALLSAAFQVSTGYMPSNVRGLDPYVTSVQWSRRFLGLRLFLSLAAAGWRGYAKDVEGSIELVRQLAENLAIRGWTIWNEPALGVLCFTPSAARDGEVLAIVSRVLASRRAWISVAIFEGCEVIQACVTHGGATSADIRELVRVLQSAAVPAGDRPKAAPAGEAQAASSGFRARRQLRIEDQN
jgi:glutamate/tyrosine decarboxylase-like PLP-dependent enzyme